MRAARQCAGSRAPFDHPATIHDQFTSSDEAGRHDTAHGVGYRFAGAVTEGPAGLKGGLPAEDAGVAEVHDLMQQYEEADRADDLERAQFLAARALVQAARSQSQAERVRVLVKCSALARRRGYAAARKLAAQALQIARGEGHPTVVAQARVAVGFVHLSAGDRGVAVRHFLESRAALSAPGTKKSRANEVSWKCAEGADGAVGAVGAVGAMLVTLTRKATLASPENKLIYPMAKQGRQR